MFLNKRNSQKEIIIQLKKENEQLKEQNAHWYKLHLSDKELRKTSDEEKELWKKMNEEANEQLEEARKLLAENRELNRQLKAMKLSYEKVIGELNEALNACRGQ